MALKRYHILIVIIILNCSLIMGQNESKPVSTLKVTTLSTMLVNFNGIGEWGYSALVEVDGKKILFDTGKYPETVLRNAEELGIDLSEVEDVFLSHNHRDHTGGLLTLRNELKKTNPNALIRVHVGKGIFRERLNYENNMPNVKAALEADGVKIIVYENQFELFSGVWITGPIKRIHDEKNWYEGGKIQIGPDSIEDTIPEDQSLVIETEDGFVLVSGCGHAGIVNTLEHIRSNIYDKRVYTVIGGFHLVNATNDNLKWTSSKLQDFGVSNIMAAHCTGINSLYTLRNLLNLSRSNAIVGSVGDSFDLEKGITAGPIAK